MRYPNSKNYIFLYVFSSSVGMDKKKKIVKCDKCWREFEIEDNEEWGYCPFCENDQVEATNCNLDEDWEE